MKIIFLLICCFVVIQNPIHAGLYEAAINGDVEAVNELLEAGEDINAVLALHGAIRYGRKEIACILIAAGANVNLKNHEGQTPLHLTARFGHYEIVSALVGAGADVNAQNKRGQTPLHVASICGHHEIVPLLLSHNARVDARDKFFGETPLHYAVFQEPEKNLNSSRIVQLLLDAHASTAAKNKCGETPLHYAAQKGYVESTAVLLTAHANPNLTNKFGRSPLHFATLMGNPAIIKLLLKSGANPYLKTKTKNETPLQVATQAGEHKSAQVIKDYLSRPEFFAFLMASHPRAGAISTAHDLPIYLFVDIFDQLRHLDRPQPKSNRYALLKKLAKI